METPNEKTPLECALALADCIADPDSSHQTWFEVASPMASYCEGKEDVTEAAARIIAAEYRRAVACIEAIEEAYNDSEDIYAYSDRIGELATRFLQGKNIHD